MAEDEYQSPIQENLTEKSSDANESNHLDGDITTTSHPVILQEDTTIITTTRAEEEIRSSDVPEIESSTNFRGDLIAMDQIRTRSDVAPQENATNRLGMNQPISNVQVIVKKLIYF